MSTNPRFPSIQSRCVRTLDSSGIEPEPKFSLPLVIAALRHHDGEAGYLRNIQSDVGIQGGLEVLERKPTHHDTIADADYSTELHIYKE
jgi:hypothetical protein